MATQEAATLFNELYVDYIQSIFFDNPEEKYTVETMRDTVFAVLRDHQVVHAVIHVLLMRKEIERINENGDTWYKASPEAIKEYNENRDLDKKIKATTKENLVAQRVPLKLWWLISLGTMGISALLSYLVAVNSNTSQPNIRREQTQSPIQQPLQPETEKDSLRDSL